MGILGLTLSPIIGDFFVELARQKGFYDNPEGVVTEFVTWLLSINQLAWYPYILGGAIGLALGVYLDWLSRKRTPPRSNIERFFDLAYSIENTREKMWNSFHQNGEFSIERINQPFIFELKSLYAAMNALGIPTPSLDDSTPHRFNILHHYYLRAMIPFAQRGQVKLAKKEAKVLISEFNQKVEQTERRKLAGKEEETQQRNHLG